MALIIPTMAKMVKGTPIQGGRIRSPKPKRFPRLLMVRPPTATATAALRTCPVSFWRAERPLRSSITPAQKRSSPPARIPRTAGVTWQKQRMLKSRPMQMAMPPRRGLATRWILRSSGLSTISFSRPQRTRKGIIARTTIKAVKNITKGFISPLWMPSDYGAPLPGI